MKFEKKNRKEIEKWRGRKLEQKEGKIGRMTTVLLISSYYNIVSYISSTSNE